MLCVLILYISGGTYSLKSISNDRFLRNFSGQFYLLSEFLPENCWEEIDEEILFVFRFDDWHGTRTLAFRLISQHTTYWAMVLPALSCCFIWASDQSDERSWSETFGASPSRKFYCNYIVVCVLCTQCLLLRSHTCLSLFLSCLLLFVYLEQVQYIC